ncbi:MAG: mechanosensitive ion channel [Myxococcales bacterium]|nr:mechanosensitive ion channel [Myxococcales bacterium]
MSETTIRLITEYAGKVLLLVALLILARLVAKWASLVVEKGLRKSKFDETLTKFFSNATRWVIITIAVIAMLGIFGVQTTSFVAVLGTAGLAIALAFQGSLANFAAGVMLLVFRPFKVGDVVSVGGSTGKVDEIGLFTTTLDTPDNRRIFMPNKSVFGTTLENISHHATRRVEVTVGTDYGADLDKTRDVLLNAAKAVASGLAEPAPAVVLVQLGGSSIDWAVRLWCNSKDFFPTKDALTREVKQHLDAAKIGIPFPQMDVHLDGGLKS